MIKVLPIALIVLSGASSAREAQYDHTSDMAVVVNFLAEMRSSTAIQQSAQIQFFDRATNSASSSASFKSYSSGCEIGKVTAVTSVVLPFPIGVMWRCSQLGKADGETVGEERFATVWVRDGVITKIKFGPIPDVSIKAPKTDG